MEGFCSGHEDLSSRKDQERCRTYYQNYVSFREFGWKMSIKMLYLFAHMDRIPVNTGSMRDEQGRDYMRI